MTVKYIHRGIMFYVSCTINSILATEWSAANQYGLQHSIAGLSHGHPTVARMCQRPLSASCQTEVHVSKAKRAVFWNAGYILSVWWTFIYFLTLQQETALLCSSPSMTGCLLLLGVIIFSTLAFLFPSTVTGERGTDLHLWQFLCDLTSLQNEEIMLVFFSLPRFADKK